MKKIFFAAAFVLCAMIAKAEVVSCDTVAYNGNYALEQVETPKEDGEVSVRYVAVLYDILNAKGKPRRVTIKRTTYESGKITHIVFNNHDNGSRKIAKAINIESK